MKKLPPAISTSRARALRKNATAAEQTMWDLIRANFPTLRWHRQVPLRHYIADFASHQLRIVVEVDGGQHSREGDWVRTNAIEAEGYRIIRFWNHDVLENPEGCMIRLQGLIDQHHPHPAATRQQAAKSSHPSPIKGEERP